MGTDLFSMVSRNVTRVHVHQLKTNPILILPLHLLCHCNYQNSCWSCSWLPNPTTRQEQTHSYNSRERKLLVIQLNQELSQERGSFYRDLSNGEFVNCSQPLALFLYRQFVYSHIFCLASTKVELFSCRMGPFFAITKLVD